MGGVRYVYLIMILYARLLTHARTHARTHAHPHAEGDSTYIIYLTAYTANTKHTKQPTRTSGDEDGDAKRGTHTHAHTHTHR
jgi:hypothetical protein